MIYEQVDEKAGKALVDKLAELQAVEVTLEALAAAIPKEDSRKREAEMREELKALRTRRNNLSGEACVIREETFKNLLAEEHGLKRTHPKFDGVYGLAYDYGHSSGFSDIENYFINLAALVKDSK